jgi:hypothetical protein
MMHTQKAKFGEGATSHPAAPIPGSGSTPDATVSSPPTPPSPPCQWCTRSTQRLLAPAPPPRPSSVESRPTTTKLTNPKASRVPTDRPVPPTTRPPPHHSSTLSDLAGSHASRHPPGRARYITRPLSLFPARSIPNHPTQPATTRRSRALPSLLKPKIGNGDHGG